MHFTAQQAAHLLYPYALCTWDVRATLSRDPHYLKLFSSGPQNCNYSRRWHLSAFAPEKLFPYSLPLKISEEHVWNSFSHFRHNAHKLWTHKLRVISGEGWCAHSHYHHVLEVLGQRCRFTTPSKINSTNSGCVWRGSLWMLRITES